jgi:hypothetical protein
VCVTRCSFVFVFLYVCVNEIILWTYSKKDNTCKTKGHNSGSLTASSHPYSLFFLRFLLILSLYLFSSRFQKVPPATGRINFCSLPNKLRVHPMYRPQNTKSLSDQRSVSTWWNLYRNTDYCEVSVSWRQAKEKDATLKHVTAAPI